MPTLADRNSVIVSNEAGADLRWTVTAATLLTVQQRLVQAGGRLPVWAIMEEDTYETAFGDGFYLHLRAIAWSAVDAELLMQRMPKASDCRWHCRSYELGLRDGQPALSHSWPREEEFYLAELLRLIAETK